MKTFSVVPFLGKFRFEPFVKRFYSSSNGVTSSSGKLDGKVAVVAASTRGLGLSMARRLLEDGAKVVIGSRSPHHVEAALKSLKSEFPPSRIAGLPFNVGKREDLKTLREYTEDTFGETLDILISNAGANPYFGNMIDCPDSAWDKIMNINVKSYLWIVQEFLPLLQKGKESSVIFVSSVAAFKAFPKLGPYAVSKAALVSFTSVLASELSTKGIRVNSIAPGIFKTEFAKTLTSDKQVAEAMLQIIPMKRFGNADEIGGVVSFLASKDSSYVTGETILVTGGIKARF